MNKDRKISYNKVLAKADLEVKILYLTEDNRINVVEGNIPVMGFIDIQDVAEDNICDVKYLTKNLVVKPNDVEEHSIYVEVEMELSCHAYAQKEINLIQDAYCPEGEMTFSKKTVTTMMEMKRIVNTYNVREQIPAGEMIGNKIYDVQVKSVLNNVIVANENAMYEGEFILTVLFASESITGLEARTYHLPFTCNMVAPGVGNNCNTNTMIERKDENFVLMPDGNIDVKMDLDFDTWTSKNAEICLIDQMEIEENRDTVSYSIVIYFVKPKDTLWEIAKKFRSTVEDIARVNGIEDVNKIYPGQQLFIPRYIPKSREATA